MYPTFSHIIAHRQQSISRRDCVRFSWTNRRKACYLYVEPIVKKLAAHQQQWTMPQITGHSVLLLDGKRSRYLFTIRSLSKSLVAVPYRLSVFSPEALRFIVPTCLYTRRCWAPLDNNTPKKNHWKGKAALSVCVEI